jgi:hypothetical protein
MLYAAKYENRSAAAVKKALGTTTVRSITRDNGSEFARHREIEQYYGAPVFFADPRSPWQRGMNENTNGLLRFFLPKWGPRSARRSFRRKPHPVRAQGIEGVRRNGSSLSSHGAEGGTSRSGGAGARERGAPQSPVGVAGCAQIMLNLAKAADMFLLCHIM